jgi:hypothetical protein
MRDNCSYQLENPIKHSGVHSYGRRIMDNKQDLLVADLVGLWKEQEDQLLIAKTIRALNARYDLDAKMAKEPGVAEIVSQMTGRLAVVFRELSGLKNKRILDIACGSNSSRLPGSLHVNTPFGSMKFGAGKGYTTLFEPWFCRILFELGAIPVGVDFGNLEKEVFIHHRVDLGKPGALDFLPAASFDGIQDSRLFGSPEFTAQFPNQADRLNIAREIRRQEQRLLKSDGIIIHSDAMELLN